MIDLKQYAANTQALISAAQASDLLSQQLQAAKEFAAQETTAKSTLLKQLTECKARLAAIEGTDEYKLSKLAQIAKAQAALDAEKARLG